MKKQLWRPKCRRDDSIEMNIGAVDWTDLAEDRIRW